MAQRNRKDFHATASRLERIFSVGVEAFVINLFGGGDRQMAAEFSDKLLDAN
jgi:hypothetical protein